MNLYATRDFVQNVINKLHDAGRHAEAFSLSDDLLSIGYQPLPTHVERVHRRAKSLSLA
jgi:hypothetical protein